MGRRHIDARRRFILAFLLTQLALVGALASAVGAQAPAPSTSPSRVERLAAARDLAADERMGGHTLARHVGKSDADLAARLRREPNISAASTYTSVEVASAAVGAALQQQSRRLADDFPALQSFLAGYLHQDFVQEHRTAAGATRAFQREADAAEQRQLADEAARFAALIESWSWSDVRGALTELGAAWRPRSRAGLVAVLKQLTP